MKKLFTLLTFIGISFSSLAIQAEDSKSSSWRWKMNKSNDLDTNILTKLFTQEVQASCEVHCPPASKAPVGPSKNTGYVFFYGGVSWYFDQLFGIDDFESSNLDTVGYDDAGYILGAGVGVQTCLLGGTRFEIEGLHSSIDPTRSGNGTDYWLNPNDELIGETKITATYINLLKEFPIFGLTAYAGGGIGYASVDHSFIDSNVDTYHANYSELTYQLIAGLEVPICDYVWLFTQYKHLHVNSGLSGIDEDYAEKLDSISTHNLVFGARVAF